MFNRSNQTDCVASTCVGKNRSWFIGTNTKIKFNWAGMFLLAMKYILGGYHVKLNESLPCEYIGYPKIIQWLRSICFSTTKKIFNWSENGNHYTYNTLFTTHSTKNFSRSSTRKMKIFFFVFPTPLLELNQNFIPFATLIAAHFALIQLSY